MIFDHYLRLEPRRPHYDLDRGIRAEIGDPLWFLGRQWQLGEHQGEDAASPVRVDVWVSEHPIDPRQGRDPQVVPPEAIVESEPDDWWTAGRRIRYGHRFAAHVEGVALPDNCYFRLPAEGTTLLGSDLPAPYQQFNDGFRLDGQQVWSQRHALGIQAALEGAFPEIPRQEPVDAWDYTRLSYNETFTCDSGQNELRLVQHMGGQVDWYSVDGAATLAPHPPNEQPDQIVMPTQLDYPGAPHDRYWQIEDHRVDVGGYPPDTAHFPTMLLVDAVASHGSEWFLFPIQTQLGRALTIQKVRVVTSLGDQYDSEEFEELQPPDHAGDDEWSLFRVAGWDNRTLLVWPTALTPLQGGSLEEVILGKDEYSNLLWAVERRVNGRDIRTPSRSERAPAAPDELPQDLVNPVQREYAYKPANGILPYWHPYQLTVEDSRRRFVQARLADYTGPVPRPVQPEPTARMLCDPQYHGQAPVHVIDPSAVPANGMQLERRWMLARDVHGNPVLWVQRQRRPVLGPPARSLRFDVLEQAI